MSRFRYVLYVCSFLALSQPLLAAASPQRVAASAETIDGSKNPERIPDVVAWLMLFQVIADGPNAPTYSVRASLVGPAGFTDGEAADVMAAANEAMSRIRAMEATTMTSAASMDEKTKMLRTQRDAILREVVGGLLVRLPADAGDKFRRHIDERVKRGIKILP